MGDSLFRIPFWLNRQRLLPQHHLVVTQFLRSQAFLVLFLVTRSEKNRYLLAHEIEWCHYIQWRYVRLCCDFSQQGLDPHQRNRDHCSWLDWQHNSQIGRLRSLEAHAQLSGTSSELWHELLNILAEIALRFWKRCAPVAQQYCNHSCRRFSIFPPFLALMDPQQ